MKIGTRLGVGFGFSILITIIVGSFAIVEMHTLENLTESMYMHPLAVSNSVRDIRADIIAIQLSMKKIELAKTSEQIGENAELVSQYEQQIYNNFDIVLDRYLGDLDEVRYVEEIFTEWRVKRDEVISLIKQGNKNAATDLVKRKGIQHVNLVMNKIEGLINATSDKSDEFLLDAEKRIKKANTILTVFLFSLVILGIISSIIITRSIVVPLNIIVQKIKNLSRGKLKENINIHSKDEVGKLADSFRELQKDLIERTQLLEQIASGDFSNDIPPRSEEDDIGKSFFVMTTSLRTTMEKLVKSELELKTSEARLQSFFLAMDDLVFVIDEEGRYTEYYQSSKTELYTPAEQFLGRKYNLVLPGNIADMLSKSIESINKTNNTQAFEYYLEMPEGKKWYSANTSKITDDKGRTVSYISVCRDITYRKEIERSLIRESSFISLLQEIAVTANESVTIENTMQACLDEVCAFMNWPVGHVYMPSDDETGVMIPTGIWHLDNPEKFLSFREATDKSTFKYGEGLPGRIMTSRKPAWIVNVNHDSNFTRGKLVENLGVKAAFGFPVLLGTEVVAVLEFFTKTEAEPDNEVLEVMANIGTQLGRVIERTRAEKELKDTTIEAESANKAKSIFLANMSHELRTPLNAILGFSQVLQLDKDILTPRQMENLGYIRDSGEHLLMMVSDILDLSKIESEKMDIEKEPFDMGNMLRKFISTLQPLADKKNIKMELDINPDIGTIDADEKRIKEILYNLLSNAIKFTDNGKKIGIKAWFMDKQIVIEVWDQGMGIENKDLEKIFDPFEQVGRAKPGTNKGTGLGLAITKKLIEAHQGTITVESTSGQGSIFTVTLPGTLEINSE